MKPKVGTILPCCHIRGGASAFAPLPFRILVVVIESLTTPPVEVVMSTLLPPVDDPLLVRALETGEAAWWRGNLVAAWRLIEQALRRAEACDNLAGALSACQLLGHIAFAAGELDAAQGYHRTVFVQSQALGLPLGEASALHNLGLIAASQGAQVEARQLIAEAAARYEALGHAAGATAARTNLALFDDHWISTGGI